MKYRHEIHDDVAVVYLNGKMLGDPGFSAFYAFVKTLREDGARHFVFDLQGVPYINSLGLGLLVTAGQSITNKEGRLAICGANDRVQALFKAVLLTSFFPHFDDCAEALASVSG